MTRSDPGVTCSGSPESSCVENLVSRIRHGNHDAFEELFRTYYEPLFAFVQTQVQPREIAEDLVQSIFVRLWEHRMTLAVRGSIRAYLYGAAKLEVIDHYRRTGVRLREVGNRTREDPIPGMGQPPPSTEDLAHATELREAIRSAAERLPERCRLIVIMRWEHQLSYAEIAHALGISQKTVENQMNIALKSFRKALQRFRP